MPDQFPTVGLGFDFDQLDRGLSKIGKLESALDRLPGKAKAASDAITQSSRKQSSAADSAARSEDGRGRAAEMASDKAAKAARKEAADAERARKYLQQVRINSIRMEEAARVAADMRASADSKRDLATMERNAKYLQQVRINSIRMEEAARLKDAAQQRADDKKNTELQERNRKYLQQVRINSLKMEEQAARAAATEEARRRAKAEADARRALGSRSSSGGSVSTSDLGLIGRFTQALSTLRNGLGATRSLLFDVRTAVGVFLGGLVIKPIIDAADAMTALESRTRLYAARASDVPYIFEQVYRTAQDARVSLEGVATLYTRLAPLSQQLGKSQSQLLETVSTVSKAFAIGGATAAEATSSAQQFAQALSSNRFGGDELRSVAENAPVLLQAIAEGINKLNPSLNLNAASFIKWAQAGNANAAIVVKALDASAAKIDAMFKQFPVTIGQATTLVSNAFQHLVGEVNKATGASNEVAAVIAKFAAFLESKKTIDAVASALTNLGNVASTTFDVMKLIGDYLPTLITLMAALAGAAGIQAVVRALVTMQVAFALAGREMTAWNVIAGLSTTAARGLWAAIGGVAGLITGGLIVALVAGAAAINTYTNAQKTADNASVDFTRNQETAINALGRAATFAGAYGLSTDGLTKALNSVTGANQSASASTKGNTDQNSSALKMAQARAEAERTLTVAILRRAAADAGKSAEDANRAAGTISTGTRVVGFLAGIGFLDKTEQRMVDDVLKKDQKRIDKAKDLAKQQGDLQKTLTQQADDLAKADLKITVPESVLPILNVSDKDLKGLDGAINRIAKMAAEVAGLKAIFDNLTSNPLSTLSEQIKAAGDEAAAQYTSGKAAKAGFADKARSLAQDKERLKILIDLKRSHLDAAHASDIEATSEKSSSDAQIRSTAALKSFWGQAERSLSGYLATLDLARNVVDDAAVAQSDLTIAQRYNATSLDDISEALEKNGIAYGKRAQDIEAAAKIEAAAAATRIRGASQNSSNEARPENIATYNRKMAEEAMDAFDVLDRRGQSLAESLSSAFGGVGDAIGGLVNIMNDYSRLQLQTMADIQAAKDTYGENSAQALDAEKRGVEALEQARLKSYGDMAAAAQDFFKRGTTGYKVLGAAEKAFRVYEFAMSARAVVVKAAETAAKVGLFGTQAAAAAQAGAAEMFASLGPLGFAAVAAMVAVLAGFGFRGGGGGGSAGPPVSEVRQNAQGSGSVLGDSEAKSESIARALEHANDLADQDLSYSQEMVRSLRNIETNIGAVASLISRQLGVGGAFSTDGLGTTVSQGGLKGGVIGGALGGAAGYGIGAAATAATGALMSGFAGAATALAGPVGLAIGAATALFSALSKTKVTTELLDQGLKFNTASLSDIVSGGLQGQTYQDIQTTKKKSIFGIGYSTKTNSTTNYQQLDADISKQLTLVVDGLKTSILHAATTLGVQGAEATLNAFQVSLGEISFKDMTGEQIEEALSAVFGKLGDDMAKYLLPAVSEFQKVGEGAFETIVRLASDYQGIDQSLSMIGMQFKTVGLESITAREYLIGLAGGLENFSDQASFFAQNFLSEADQLKPYQDALAQGLAKIGQSSISTRDDFAKLVQGLDVSNSAGADLYQQLMDLAPLFDRVASAQEKRAKEILDKRTSIQDEIDKLTLNDAELLKKTRQQEMAAVVALDPALGSLLQQLYDLQDSANAAADAAAKLNDQQNLYLRLLNAQGRTQEAKQYQRDLELSKTTDPIQQALLRRIYAAEDAQEALTKAQDAVSTAADNLRSAYETQKQTLEETRDKFRDFAKALLEFRDSLDTGELSNASREQVYRITSQRFAETAKMARLGNEDALGNLPNVSQEFLQASKDRAKNALEYNLDLASVKNATDEAAATAGRQADIAQKQLDALNLQVGSLISINESVLSVGDAISKFMAAQMQLSTAQSAAQAAGVVVNSPTSPSTNPVQVTGPGSTGNANMDWILANSLAGLKGAGYDPAFSGLYQNAQNYKPGYMDIYQVYGVDVANKMVSEGKLKFASGAAFDAGSIVRNATNFDIGQMGEDGPEAIMPLVQTSGGLGVRAVGGSNDNAALQQAIVNMADDQRRFQIRILQLLDQNDTREARRDASGQLVRGAPEPLSPVNVKVV